MSSKMWVDILDFLLTNVEKQNSYAMFTVDGLNADILSKDEKCEDTTLKLLVYLSTAVNSCYQNPRTIENQEGTVNFTVSIEQ